MPRRWWCALLGLAVGSLLVAGCGESPPDPPDEVAVVLAQYTPLAAAGTASAGALQVLTETHYTTDFEMIVLGAIRNAAPAPAPPVQLMGEVRTPAGLTVGLAPEQLLQDLALPAGATAPFRVVMSSPTGPPTGTIHLWWRDASASSAPPARPAPGLVVEAPQLIPNPAGAQFTGRVRNRGPAPTQAARILALGYDATGQLVDVAAGALAEAQPLPAGAAGAFDLTFRRPQVAIQRVETLLVAK